ncbi:right-handed parallel beta-helix repeat-containing protein [Candidatus Eisenbacteria bacterium]|uniref:Right-handed parallel beta-helix repeat-containing protein n=1 Tax=Eiseniibacteriota bacterium TaxID=2212470 RepID=A0ABV6YJY7_UNCEI
MYVRQALAIAAFIFLGPATSPRASRTDLSRGVLIAHYTPSIVYSELEENWYAPYFTSSDAIYDDEDQNVYIDRSDGYSVWYVLAAWDEAKAFCAVVFGLGDFSMSDYHVEAGVACVPPGEGWLELPTAGWPGPNEGIAVTNYDTWFGHLVPVYGFAGYAYYETGIPLSVSPVTGAAAFTNCEGVPVDFPAACLGTMGVLNPDLGVECHVDEERVCCVGPVCSIVTESVCVDHLSGTWYPERTECDPNPCGNNIEERVCCVGPVCSIVTESVCVDHLSGTWYPERTECDPNPCGNNIYLLQPDGLGDFPTIQTAIDAAADGDIIELADGLFAGDGNRDIDFLGKALTVRSQSGDPEACIIDCDGSAGSPHRGFAFRTGEGPGSVLEGLTITGGVVSGSDEFGGAVICDGASPTIVGCIFLENVASDGGGMYCIECSPTILNCAFLQNTALEGGGLKCYSSHVSLAGCSFTGNTATDMGGGMSAVLSSPQITSCSFLENTAPTWAGGCFLSSTTAVLTGCTFSANSTDGRGGGLLCIGGHDRLINCTFFGNEALEGSGVCSAWHGDISLENTLIAYGIGNMAVYHSIYSNAELSCCNIYGNEGGNWAGMIGVQRHLRGNLYGKPLFCDPDGGDFSLSECSPCAPFTPPNEECDLIGAWPVACVCEILPCCVGQECHLVPYEVCNSMGGDWVIDPPQASCEPNPCLTPTLKTSWGGIKAMFRETVK